MPVSFELGEVEAVVEGAEVVPVEREENSANLEILKMYSN
jgi:hypothetical protein